KGNVWLFVTWPEYVGDNRALEGSVMRDHFGCVGEFGRGRIPRTPQLHRAIVNGVGDAPHVGGRVGGVAPVPDLAQVERAARFNIDDDTAGGHDITRCLSFGGQYGKGVAPMFSASAG